MLTTPCTGQCPDGFPYAFLNGASCCAALAETTDASQGEGCDYGELLARLIEFRKANPALENGQWGAVMHKVENSAPEQLFAWVRQEDGNKVLGLFNMSGKPLGATFSDGLPEGEYTDFATGEPVTIGEGHEVTLPAWGYRLLSSGSR